MFNQKYKKSKYTKYRNFHHNIHKNLHKQI